MTTEQKPSGLTVNGVRVPHEVEAKGAAAIDAFVAAQKPAPTKKAEKVEKESR